MKDFKKTPTNILCHALSAAVVLAPASGFCVDIFTDNFDDGNDEGWTHFGLENIGFPEPAYEFPDDIFGGKAYRIATPAPPIPDAGPARAFSFLAEHPLSDFLIEADLLDWNNDIDQAFGFLIRAENIALGQTTGYVLNYDPQQESGGRGQLQINRVVGEASDETIAAGNITLQPGEDYRLVAVGMGPNLYAAVFSLRDLTEPIVVINAFDEAFSSGVFGLFNFSRVDAEDYTNAAIGRTDMTFDNFRLSDDPTEAIEPFLGSFLYAGRPSIPGQPMFLGKTPAAMSSYFLPETGLDFAFIPAEGNPIDTSSVRLTLNGTDVSASLSLSQDNGLWSAVYTNLEPNTIYEARAEVSATNGQSSSMQWVFDTVQEAALNAPEVIVIEAEDYNYQSGQYQNNPPVSGFTFDFVQVRGNGEGYLDLIGTPGVDYFDYSDQAGGGIAPEYRLEDNVGTQIGAMEIEPSIFPVNDWNREKYIVDNLEEYQVRRTEGGEWMNYTRDFPEGNYEVYLRSASRAEQTVLLDRVVGSASVEDQAQAVESIGQFNLPNDGMNIWYRFTQLVDGNGQPVVVSLSGKETVRLTIGGEREDRTKYTAVLNYLVFAPAAEGPDYQLFASSSPNAPFTEQTNAVLDAAAGTFTLPMEGPENYFRIQGAAATRITGIRIQEGSLVLEFANE